MPNTRKRGRGCNKAGHKKEMKTTNKYSVEDLLEKANNCIEQFQFELACKFCQRALELESQNLHALNTYACVLLELGDAEKAYDQFQQLIKLSPDSGHEKYMYLGQMCSGADAANYFNKGIEILKAELQQGTSAASSLKLSNLSQEISRAFCSLAEIYLTDCCFDKNAAQYCENYCRNAIEYNAENADAYQLLASCLLSQDQIDNAREYMQKSVSLWLPACRNLDSNFEETEEDVLIPSYDSRITSAKLLIELEQYEIANEILDRLLQDDDEVIQVWYLLGWLYYLQKDLVAARQHLEMAKTLSEKLHYDDSKVNEHIEELLMEIPINELTEDDVENEDEDDDDDHVMETEDSPSNNSV